MVRTPPFIGVRAIESFMAMLDIEYRYSGRPTSGEVRRADWEEMEKYLRGLVYEMQEADISSKYIGKKTENEDMLYINGKSVIDILEGLDIRTPMPDECVDRLLQSHLNRTNILSKTHRKKSLVCDVS